jgi:hypothetical protein
MISLILRVGAFILFLIAGFGGSLFHHGGLSLVAISLACWVLSTLLGGYGPASPWVRE